MYCIRQLVGFTVLVDNADPSAKYLSLEFYRAIWYIIQRYVKIQVLLEQNIAQIVMENTKNKNKTSKAT